MNRIFDPTLWLITFILAVLLAAFMYGHRLLAGALAPLAS